MAKVIVLFAGQIDDEVNLLNMFDSAKCGKVSVSASKIFLLLLLPAANIAILTGACCFSTLILRIQKPNPDFSIVLKINLVAF